MTRLAHARGMVVGAVSAACVALLVACPPSPQPPVDPSPRDGSAPIVEDGSAYPECRAACARLWELGCPEGVPFDGGSTCFRVCAEAEASGKFDLKPTCLASAHDVAGVRACRTVRCAR